MARPPHDIAAASPHPGRLLVVATPIGNLGDLSPRAREALAGADIVACEDTRHTGLLLSRLGIKARLVSLHEHNERARLPSLLSTLAEGKTVVLVSDAGTPLVSDPGFLLVREAVAVGATVEAIPGPSALLAALVVSGLPPLPFTFAGFPPQKPGKRRTFFTRLAALEHTVVFYESPHRLAASLADAAATFGDRPAVVARELTKLHEELRRGTLADLATSFTDEKARGEVVIVVGPAAASSAG
ncbi:MAG TPA: 16S rRNA (cytidine(1402)-2'-O)-methyltransferase [Thermoanaerobaculia bacterium]|nr:16S rRNA (cytidine(1402)-2'-O)-methyltransferase [Thermoanaerobaculia bacterium]